MVSRTHGRARRHVLVWTLALGVPVAAQDAQFRSRVDVVEIDVRIVDGNGRPVTDLSPDEIELREDDRLQKLSDVVRVVRPLPDFAAPLTVAARVPIAEGADVASNFGAADARIYALFLDDLHVDARRTLEVRNLARRFVQKYVAPGDQVAVVHASGRTDAAHGFTANRALLLAAIDQFSPRKVRPATVERYALYEDARRFDRRVGPQDLRDTSDAERARNALVALQTLQGITTSLGRITGRRKAIVLISEGTDHDLSGVSNGPAMLGPISSRSPTLGGLMTGQSGPQIASALHAVVAYATRANVTVYAFDPRKGSIEDEAAQLRLKSGDPELRISELDLASEKQDAQSMLGGLAQQTGGVAILAGNYDQGFERLVRDGSDYYLLRYTPDRALSQSGFRRVAVTVRRPGVRLIARPGYFADATDSAAVLSADGLSPELGAALGDVLPVGNLPLRGHAAAFKGTSRKEAQVVATLQVPGGVLASGVGQRLDTTLEVAGIAIAGNGGRRSAIMSTVTVGLEGTPLVQLRRSDYRIVSRMALPPGRHELRLGVRDRRTGRIGTMGLSVDVPDFSHSREVASGLVLSSALSNAMPSSTDAGTQALVPLLPSALRFFTTADELHAALFVYPRNREELEVRSWLEGANGAIFAESRGPLTTEASGAPVVHFRRLPLADVPPGGYLVAVEVRRKGAKDALVRRETRVTVSGGSRTQ